MWTKSIRVALLVSCSLIFLLPAKAVELVFLVSSGEAQPLANAKDGKLKGGILKDIGDAIAEHQHVHPTYLLIPRKRLPQKLEDNTAHVLCGSNPAWLKGNFEWSKPVFGNTGILVSNGRVPRPNHLGVVAGKPVGTVLGYVYPEFSAELGEKFVRDDAPSMTSNIRKLFLARFDYAAVDELSYRYMLMDEKPTIPLNEPFIMSQYEFYCAVGKQSPVSVIQLNQAIADLNHLGRIKEILAKYR